MERTPPPIPPVPIEYARPIPPDQQHGPRRARILSPRIAFHVWAIAGAALMTSCFAIPKFEQVFKDFRMELPWVTRWTLIFSRLMSHGWMWLPAIGVGFGLPFGLTALLNTGSPSPDERRTREKWTCRGLRMVALLVILWTALAIFLPYSKLITTLSGSGGGK